MPRFFLEVNDFAVAVEALGSSNQPFITDMKCTVHCALGALCITIVLCKVSNVIAIINIGDLYNCKHSHRPAAISMQQLQINNELHSWIQNPIAIQLRAKWLGLVLYYYKIDQTLQKQRGIVIPAKDTRNATCLYASIKVETTIDIFLDFLLLPFSIQFGFCS